MKKVEQYIKEHTRNCSNEIGYCHNKTRNHNHVFYSWLSPDHVRKAVEIAREEMIEKVTKFFSKKENVPLWDDNSGDFGCDNLLLINKLTQVMKDE